jgi:NADH pyrophosphatase NudC (nudix superfamily)
MIKYNGVKTELADIFWKGYYSRTEKIMDGAESLYVTRTLNSEVQKYIDEKIEQLIDVKIKLTLLNQKMKFCKKCGEYMYIPDGKKKHICSNPFCPQRML